MSGFSPFQPPQYSYGGAFGRYVIMEVVDRDDPEQAGRVRCRVFGYQNDQANIPDGDLLWARPVAASTNPLNGGIGTSPTGPMVGTYLIGFFADGNQQLLYTGSIGKSGNGENGEFNQNGRNHDSPMASRDQKTGGADVRFDSSTNSFGQASIIEYARDEAANPYGRTVSFDGSEDSTQAWSLGTYQF